MHRASSLDACFLGPFLHSLLPVLLVAAEQSCRRGCPSAREMQPIRVAVTSQESISINDKSNLQLLSLVLSGVPGANASNAEYRFRRTGPNKASAAGGGPSNQSRELCGTQPPLPPCNTVKTNSQYKAPQNRWLPLTCAGSLERSSSAASRTSTLCVGDETNSAIASASSNLSIWKVALGDAILAHD